MEDRNGGRLISADSHVAISLAAVRERVPMMDVDREVSGQIIAVDGMLPDLVEVAAARCGGLR